MRKLIIVLAAVASLALVPGCSTKRGTGTAIGAGVGAGAGYLIGRNNGGGGKGAAIGAAVGAGAGYIIGNEMDKDDEEQKRLRENTKVE